MQSNSINKILTKDICDEHGVMDVILKRTKKHACVGIITRTKDRPLLLQRAAKSVAAQTFGDYVWVVVNDGGDSAAVDVALSNSNIDNDKIVVVNLIKNRGMESASNIGIAACDTEFLLIHDDDDSLEPEFLTEMIEFLRSKRGLHYGGAISKTVLISEEIALGAVVEHSREPFNEWIKNIEISDIAERNLFPPISFVFRRSVLDEVGGFNEDLPVLGDWFFNLEFLLVANIGVVKSTAARYHVRDRGELTGIYSNSIVASADTHQEFVSIVRNSFIRKHKDNLLSIALLMRPWSNMYSRTAVNHQGLQSCPKSIEKDYDHLWVVNCLNHLHLIPKAANIGEFRACALGIDSDFAELIALIIQRKIELPAPPNFDENAYLNRYPDVKVALGNGEFTNGYTHFLAFGADEGRKRFGKS